MFYKLPYGESSLKSRMKTNRAENKYGYVTEHPSGMACRTMMISPPTDLEQGCFLHLLGIYMHQRLGKSLLLYTCNNRGARTRGRVLHWAEGPATVKRTGTLDIKKRRGTREEEERDMSPDYIRATRVRREFKLTT
jgi:hypothetical protein